MKRIPLTVGATLISAVVLLAITATFWTPFDPAAQPGPRLTGPSWPYLLGTDGFGADILSRIMSGARICLLVGVLSVAAAALIGVPLGIVAGMARGWVAHLIARAVDILYGFPALLLAILFAAAVGGSTWTAMAAIAISSIPAFVRISRAATLQIMSMGYVEASRLAGTSYFAIARRHVLPNIAPVIGVQASVSFGMAILAEAGLSYLGLGSGPGQATWGRMLREAQDYLFSEPMVAFWPGVMIAGATLGFNLLGDGLRDVLDPKLREVT